MARYQKGTMGKLIVQDWNVIQSYDSDPLLYILTPPQAAALISLAESLYWFKRWLNPPDRDTLDAFTAETIFNLMNPITCEMLNACLAPAFADLQEKLDQLQASVEANAAVDRGVTQVSEGDDICGGATALVMAMQAQIELVYAESEAGVVDNVFELIPRVLSAIPIFGSLPFDELFSLVNWMFENQVLEEKVDYDLIKDDIICDLKCFVQANDNTFTWDVWADWLDYVGETYPTNRAAGLFSRFSPTRQTWLNQIAAFFNQDASLQAYFDELSVAWEGGILNPLPCTDCECPDGEVSVYSDFGRTTLKYTIPYTLGVPFEIEVDPSTWGTNEWFAVWGVDLDYSYDVLSGVYTATSGEAPWAYIDDMDTVISGLPGNPATDLANPGTARGIFMNANELDTSTHIVEVTLTAP